MKLLLSRLANPFLCSNLRGKAPTRNALHQGCESKRPEIVDFLLSIPPDPIEGWFDINQQDVWGETPLHVAVYGKTASALKCAQLLLERGARRDLQREDDFNTPLHQASFAQEEVKLAFVDILTSDQGAHINAKDSRGRTPIFGFLDHVECVRMLLGRGADITICDNQGMTVLHACCIENRIDSLKLFMESSNHTLDTVIDYDGDTPLAKAIECKSIDCAKLLLDAGAISDLNGKDGLTIVHRAIDMGNPNFLKDCFDHPTYKKGVRTYDGMTVMEYAGRKERFDGRIKDLILEYESYGPRLGSLVSQNL
jgi:ankyrin repeat protein